MDNDIAVFKKQLSLKDMEKKLFAMPQVEMPLRHNFADGVYVRELFMPKDTIVIGKRHRFETCNILLKGELSLYMGKGVQSKRIRAPYIFNSKPGTKKMAYVHEDSIFLNIHPTDETDLEKIENEFIISEEEFEKMGYEDIKQIERGDL